MTKLTQAQIETALAALPEWKLVGHTIRRTYTFKDFKGALKFVNAVGNLAEKAGHHPDIDIRWNKVTLSLTTHSEGGLTANDPALAAECDQVKG
jgi:4a-hydroxytetrahydrobiopterin dehydratase